MPGHFYIRPPSQINNCLLKGWGFLDPIHIILPQRESIGARFGKIHSNMADLRSSSSRPRSPKPERCSVPHSRLVELLTKGFLPPAYMVPVRAGLATYNGGSKRRASPVPLRGAGMPCSLLIKGTQISNSSVPPRAPGVLQPPTA